MGHANHGKHELITYSYICPTPGGIQAPRPMKYFLFGVEIEFHCSSKKDIKLLVIFPY